MNDNREYFEGVAEGMAPRHAYRSDAAARAALARYLEEIDDDCVYRTDAEHFNRSDAEARAALGIEDDADLADKMARITRIIGAVAARPVGVPAADEYYKEVGYFFE